MKDVLIRALRTYVQTALGLIIASSVFQKGQVGALSVVVSLAVSAIPAGLAVIQNALENTTNVPIPKG